MPLSVRPAVMLRSARVRLSPATQTRAVLPSNTTADSGTPTALLSSPVTMRKRANISGFRAWSRLSTTARTGSRRVAGSMDGAT